MEYRIYVDEELRNICSNDYVFMSNLSNYRDIYGKERVEYKTLSYSIMDEEKLKWLKSIGRK